MSEDAQAEAERIVDGYAYDLQTHRDDYDTGVAERRDALVAALAAAITFEDSSDIGDWARFCVALSALRARAGTA